MGFFGGGAGITYGDFVGATTSTAGTAGLVPAPAAGKNTRALFSDGTFVDSQMYPRRSGDSNRFIKAYGDYFGIVNEGQSARQRIFTLIYVHADGNIDEIKTRTGTGAISSAFNINLALWEASEQGQPSTYVVGGDVSSGTSTSTEITLSVASTAVKRGWYYISLTPETLAPSQSINRLANSGATQIFLGSDAMNSVSIQWSYTATTYNQTIHETFTRSALNPPNVAVTWV